LGDRMIFISVGSKDVKRLKDGDEIIKVKNPSGFTQLVEKGDDLMIDTRKFVHNTNDLVTKLNLVMNEVIEGKGLAHDVIYEKSSGEVLASINDILNQLGIAGRNLSGITGKINDGEGTLGALVNDAALYNDIKMLFGKANRNRLIRSVIRYTLQTREKEQLK
jgi:phospholipid/cholesterol/gamma-HCH transport system substrate-binding protein